MRGGFDENEDKMLNLIKRFMPEILEGWIPVDVMLNALGMEMSGYIQKYAKNLNSPANSDTTKASKRSSNPLLDTGRLIGAIRHEVE